jgi:hypothetical protein
MASDMTPWIRRGFEVDDEQPLPAGDLGGVVAFPFHTDNDCSDTVAKIDLELDQLIGIRYVVDADDRPDPDVDPVENVRANGGLHGCGCHSRSRILTPLEGAT